jgi:hypothetical protein
LHTIKTFLIFFDFTSDGNTIELWRHNHEREDVQHGQLGSLPKKAKES